MLMVRTFRNMLGCSNRGVLFFRTLWNNGLVAVMTAFIVTVGSVFTLVCRVSLAFMAVSSFTVRVLRFSSVWLKWVTHLVKKKLTIVVVRVD